MHAYKPPDRAARATLRHTANLLGALATALSDQIRKIAYPELERGSSHVAALLSIGTRPGTSISALSRVVGSSHSAAVRLVDGLVAEGLVRRVTAPDDARQVELSLTAAGQKLFDTVRHRRLSALARYLEILTPSERKTLHRLLDKLLSPIATDADGARHVCRFCDHSCCRGLLCPVGRPFHHDEVTTT